MNLASQRTPRGSFVPITIAQYVPLHMKINPAESRTALEAALRESLEAAERGECCDCGGPTWVLGSAIVGRGCLTCITGQNCPDDDYEIIAVLWQKW